ncbi:MAG: rRNA maturation RNase YbeY [Syntrophobacteraceae bacterium]
MGYTEAELSVLIIDDAAMAQINLEYRGVDHATDVLSFPMLEGECSDVCPEMLGDVVISAETARAIADETASELESVMDLLLAHGILHLIGFDHEAGDAEAVAMREKTEELLVLLGRSGMEFGWFFDVED